MPGPNAIAARAFTPLLLTVALASLLQAGCRKGASRAAASSFEPDAAFVAEPRLGPDPPSEPHLGFRIVKVYEAQQVTDAAPWHASGGTWTFFDAELPGSPPVPFTVGMMAQETRGTPIGFGKAMIIAPDPGAGGRFIERFAVAFHRAAPPSPAQTKLPRPAAFSIAILGEKMERQLYGDFGAQGRGTWTASKWFFEDGDSEAEVFFNFDLSAGRGEFAEKDEEYRDALVAALTAQLRDGPR